MIKIESVAGAGDERGDGRSYDGGLLLNKDRGGVAWGRDGRWDGGNLGVDNGRREEEVGDVLVLVPNGLLGGDVGGAGVLELVLELFDVGGGGEEVFSKVSELLLSGVDEGVEGRLGEDAGKGGVRRRLVGEGGKGTKVVLKGGGGGGDVGLVLNVELRGPRGKGGGHWR